MKMLPAVFKRPIGLFTLSFALILSACGNKPENQIVRNVQMSSIVRDGDVWLDFATTLKLGNMTMTSVTLPIMDPRFPEERYGEISFKPVLHEGANEIGIKVNLTKAARIQGGYPTLPNGAALPLGGQRDKNIVELEIAQIHSKIYLGLDHDFTMIGFAIGIKEFDMLTRYIGGSNIFFGFNIQQVLGMVGLFTGSQTYQSGLAFFADLSSVISPSHLNDILAGGGANYSSYSAALTSGSYKSLLTANEYGADYKQRVSQTFQGTNLSNSRRKKLYKGLQDMSSRTNHLNFVQ